MSRSGSYATALLLAGAIASAGAASLPDGELTISLSDGLAVQDIGGGKGAPPPLRKLAWTISIATRDGRTGPTAWGRVDGDETYEHWGRVERASMDGEAASLAVAIGIRSMKDADRGPYGDGVFIGGSGRWEIDLVRHGGAWSGRWRAQLAQGDSPQLRAELDRIWQCGWIGGGGWSMDRLKPVDARARVRLPTAALDGACTAVLAPLAARQAAAPIAPGEHPRLFLRKADLPRLRAAAATPQGRRIVQAVEEMLERQRMHGFAYHKPAAGHSMFGPWGSGHALLYALTGDPAHARRAMETAAGAPICVYPYGNGGFHPYNLIGVAIAYDLCHDAWPAAFRDYIWAYLYQNIRDLAKVDDQPDHLRTRSRYGFGTDLERFDIGGIHHAYAAKFRAAAAIGALAIIGDAPPIEEPPSLDRVPTIAPATGYRPWIGTPVVPFTDGKFPAAWLLNGPFVRDGEDPLASLGGLGGCRPEDGQRVAHRGASLEFRAYFPSGVAAPVAAAAKGEDADPDAIPADGKGPRIYPRNCAAYWFASTHGGFYPGIDLWKRLTAEMGKPPGTAVAIYTVLDNDVERVVQCRPNWGWQSSGVRMWLNGTEVADGQLVRLAPGLYPWMCYVPVTGGYSNQGPHLSEYTAADLAEDRERVRLAAQAFSAQGTDELRLMRDILLRSARRFIAGNIGPQGSGGWQAGVEDAIIPLLAAWKQLSGEDLSAGTGVQELVPMAVRRRQQAGSREFLTMITHGLGLVPERHLGLAEWLIDQEGWSMERPHEALIALAALPSTWEPVAPAGKVPLASLCPGTNQAEFASGFSGADGFLVAVTGGGPLASWANSGDLVITGKGRTWLRPTGQAYGPIDLLRGNRAFCPEFMPAAPARIVHSELLQDGSGTVSFLCDRFARGTWVNNFSRQESRGNIDSIKNLTWKPGGPAPGISHLRAVAVDYSGLGGAPCVVAVADRFTGMSADNQKTWQADLTPVSDRYEAFEHKRYIQIAPRKGGDKTGMRISFPLPVDAEFKHTTYATGGPVVGVVAQVHLHRLPTEREQGERDRAAAGIDQAAGGRPAKRRKGAADDLSGDDLDHIAGEVDRKIKGEDRKAQVGDAVFLAVIAIQDGTPAAVEPVPGEARPSAMIGRRTFILDGGRLIMGRQ